jgi:hypothetical protein
MPTYASDAREVLLIRWELSKKGKPEEERKYNEDVIIFAAAFSHLR